MCLFVDAGIEFFWLNPPFSSAILRVLRVTRVLRLGKFVQYTRRFRGIRRLLRVMRSCFWTLLNIVLLLLLVLICYALAGMQLFGSVTMPQAGILDEVNNVRVHMCDAIPKMTAVRANLLGCFDL